MNHGHSTPGFFALLARPANLLREQGIWGAREELARILTFPKKEAPAVTGAEGWICDGPNTSLQAIATPPTSAGRGDSFVRLASSARSPLQFSQARNDGLWRRHAGAGLWLDVRYGSLADISERTRGVRFTPEGDMLSVSIDVH